VSSILNDAFMEINIKLHDCQALNKLLRWYFITKYESKVDNYAKQNTKSLTSYHAYRGTRQMSNLFLRLQFKLMIIKRVDFL
jgi:hypothetical protein